MLPDLTTMGLPDLPLDSLAAGFWIHSPGTW